MLSKEWIIDGIPSAVISIALDGMANNLKEEKLDSFKMEIFSLKAVSSSSKINSQTSSNSVRETVFYAKNGNPDWLVVRSGVQLTAADLISKHKLDLGLTVNDELIQYRVDTDELGYTHTRYHQYHRGVKVDAGELLIHEKNGRVQTPQGYHFH